LIVKSITSLPPRSGVAFELVLVAGLHVLDHRGHRIPDGLLGQRSFGAVFARFSLPVELPGLLDLEAQLAGQPDRVEQLLSLRLGLGPADLLQAFLF
jgi:hypothetical protein